MAQQKPPEYQQQLRSQRWRLLSQLIYTLEPAMIALSVIWLILIVVDLTSGLAGYWQTINAVIWILFVVDFLLELLVAPDRKIYLRHHWLTAVSLVVPAFRVLGLLRLIRLIRAASAARALNILRFISSINRGMGTLGRILRHRGFGYVVALTTVVVFAGAGLMQQFEDPASLRQQGFQRIVDAGGGFTNYADALWWTAMIMTTMGSEYWPHTTAGRVVCLILSIYAFAVFGFITANIASYLVGQEKAKG